MKLQSRISHAVVVIAALSLGSACVDGERSQAGAEVHAVTIMTFNVENLFDTEDDPDKVDDTFLPLAKKQSAEHRESCAPIEVDRWRDQCLNWDWNERILEHKLDVIAAAILQVGNGRGADIVALQEVENVDILERLRIEYLGAAGYRPAILIEGDDARGIDVAFLTRLELADTPVLHPIAFADEFADRAGDTRGILQADFLLPDGTTLTGFSVHFPAPFHPTGMRIAAYEALNRLRQGLPPTRPAFAAGDFNTTSGEDREEDLLGRFARPYWTVTHESGCDSCRGTQYYAPDDSWSFLDMILWSPGQDRGADATWRLRKNSVRIANAGPHQMTADGTPARFSLPAGTGVSDHWPVVITIEPNRNKTL